MTLSGYQRICVEKCLKESKNKRVIIIIVGDGPRLDCRRHRGKDAAPTVSFCDFCAFCGYSFK